MELIYDILIWIFLALQALLGFYLFIPFLFLCLYTIKGGKKNSERKFRVKNKKNFDFAAIITAHQDLNLIPALVDSFSKQSYRNFIVYIIADDCDVTNLTFSDPRIRILKPEKTLHAKIRSIQYAVDHFIRPHEALVIFDSDNLIHPGCLETLNRYFQYGFRAVQAHTVSKNTDTIIAKLDSMGHTYNTFVERQAKMSLGFSSSITGSGVAIETELYRQVMYNKNTLGGFDKKLQADIIRQVPTLAFAENAIVFDEKVDDGDTLEKQRTRWIYTYFKYFSVNWSLFLSGLKRMNLNIIFFAFSALRPPLFIMIGLACFCMGIDFFLNPVFSWIWLGILCLFVFSFIMIVVIQSRRKGMLKVILYIPLIVIRQVNALFKMKKASKSFLKTEHVKLVYIEDLLKNEDV